MYDLSASHLVASSCATLGPAATLDPQPLWDSRPLWDPRPLWDLRPLWDPRPPSAHPLHTLCSLPLGCTGLPVNTAGAKGIVLTAAAGANEIALTAAAGANSLPLLRDAANAACTNRPAGGRNCEVAKALGWVGCGGLAVEVCEAAVE